MHEFPGSAVLWRREDALASLTRGQVQARVVGSIWQSPFRKVYAAGETLLTPELWELAAALASTATGQPMEEAGRPAVAACLRSAARVWDLPLIDDDDPATGAAEHLIHDVLTNRNMAPLPPEGEDGHLVVRHRSVVRTDELVRRPSGLWVTDPIRTAVDCARLLTAEAAVCLLDQGLRRGMFTKDELLASLAEAPGRPGSRQAARCIELADGRSESPAETLARLLLRPHLPGLTPQVRVRNRNGRIVARVDLGDDEVRLAVELDGKRWHSGEQMVARDRARDRVLEQCGWWTERATWFELRRQQAELVARVRARHGLLSERAA